MAASNTMCVDQVVMDREHYIQAMDRLLLESSFRTNLEERPVETLNEMGIVLGKEEAEKLLGKTFSEVYNEQTLEGVDKVLTAKATVAVIVGVTTTT
jgi:hypothetical protein